MHHKGNLLYTYNHQLVILKVDKNVQPITLEMAMYFLILHGNRKFEYIHAFVRFILLNFEFLRNFLEIFYIMELSVTLNFISPIPHSIYSSQGFFIIRKQKFQERLLLLESSSGSGIIIKFSLFKKMTVTVNLKQFILE